MEAWDLYNSLGGLGKFHLAVPLPTAVACPFLAAMHFGPALIPLTPCAFPASVAGRSERIYDHGPFFRPFPFLPFLVPHRSFAGGAVPQPAVFNSKLVCLSLQRRFMSYAKTRLPGLFPCIIV